ncbi:hypothetical protein HanRHA438_Chr11g0482641 [Helianthus annuus]|nr:hypothetical protein HanRHA438_Chr11g0482641 [Helianthus annuus]
MYKHIFMMDTRKILVELRLFIMPIQELQKKKIGSEVQVFARVRDPNPIYTTPKELHKWITIMLDAY